VPVTVPAKTEDSIGVEKSDALPEGFTPNPKHYTSAAQLERMKDSLIEIAEKVNDLEGGVTVDPSDSVPSEISTAAGSAGTSPQYSRADHVHELAVLTGADFADPVLRSASSDLGGSGAQLTPGGLTTGGTSGGTDLLIAPGAATAGAGKAVLIQAGTGATNQNGGPLTLDAGGSNGGGSSAGNVRIGRDVAEEVLIGREDGGALITLQGTVATEDHTPSAPEHVATKGYVDGAIVAALDWAEAGDLAAIGTAAAAGASTEIPRADHVHAHGAQTDGTLHARVTASAHGFLDRDVFDGSLGKGTNWHRVWCEVFKGTLDAKLAADASGTGAAAQVTVASGFEGIGRLVGGTGASAYGGHRAALNWYYNGAAAALRIELVGRVLGPLADATDDYRVHLCGLGAPPTGAWTGFSIVYDRAAPVNPGNWQIARYNGGTPTYVDLGVAVDTNSHRFVSVFDVATATVSVEIDGVARGSIATVPSVSAAYPFAAYVARVAGASREFYEEFTDCWVKYATARPG
jgi:hypothetical protein